MIWSVFVFLEMKMIGNEIKPEHWDPEENIGIMISVQNMQQLEPLIGWYLWGTFVKWLWTSFMAQLLIEASFRACALFTCRKLSNRSHRIMDEHTGSGFVFRGNGLYHKYVRNLFICASGRWNFWNFYFLNERVVCLTFF